MGVIKGTRQTKAVQQFHLLCYFGFLKLWNHKIRNGDCHCRCDPVEDYLFRHRSVAGVRAYEQVSEEQERKAQLAIGLKEKTLVDVEIKPENDQQLGQNFRDAQFSNCTINITYKMSFQQNCSTELPKFAFNLL